MDPAHARMHLDELRGRAVWLRALTPESPRYKLWLGDLVEFTRAVFGLDSPEMAAVREVLAARPPSDADEATRVRDYVQRLDRLIALIDRFARRLATPLPLVEVPPNGRNPATG